MAQVQLEADELVILSQIADSLPKSDISTAARPPQGEPVQAASILESVLLPNTVPLAAEFLSCSRRYSTDTVGSYGTAFSWLRPHHVFFQNPCGCGYVGGVCMCVVGADQQRSSKFLDRDTTNTWMGNQHIAEDL